MVASALRTAHGLSEDMVQIVPITTTGDVIQDRPLSEVGGKGLWTKELDRCLSDGRTDMSVHSMKDVETLRPPELRIAAMLPRADVCDRLIGADSICELRKGARVGTSSPRRAAQLLALRPDLEIVTFRGNVQTRLAKLEAGEAEATLLAAAGLERLGLFEVGTVLNELLPAPSQGAVGVEVRIGADSVADLVRAIDHRETHACVAAERRLLEGLRGTCRSPVAALARLRGEKIHLRAEILTGDGAECQHGSAEFAVEDDEAPLALARELLGKASPELRALFEA